MSPSTRCGAHLAGFDRGDSSYYRYYARAHYLKDSYIEWALRSGLGPWGLRLHSRHRGGRHNYADAASLTSVFVIRWIVKLGWTLGEGLTECSASFYAADHPQQQPPAVASSPARTAWTPTLWRGMPAVRPKKWEPRVPTRSPASPLAGGSATGYISGS